MNYEQLATYRTVLLDLYTPLHAALGKEGKRVDAGLRDRQKNIEEEKFLLAIVGEVKAGKSTFINALLGEAILPYDALQATSEIIEIDKSDKKEVRVTFANGTEQVVEDDLRTPENEAVPFLKKIAAVKEEYRDIPIVQVNKFLMDRYTQKNKRAVFSEKELRDFIDAPELENVHKLAKEAFARKIREYVQNNISCAEIPKEIALGYPIEFLQSKHFKIVDTPGINAIGGIEDQTKNFINQADAVIYLHKVGQQESIALRNALENVIPERVKKRLILVLTHGSQMADERDRERILEATESYYPGIGTDNIFLVDSLTELYLRESLYKAKTMDEIQTILSADSKIMGLTAPCFFKANGDRNEFLDLLEAQANFDEIRERIKRDAQNSASIQMKQFANDLKEEYEVLDNSISARIDPLRKKYKNPQTFALEIQKHKDETERVRRDYNVFTAELREEFNPQDRNSRYYRKIDQIVKGYIAKVNGKEFDTEYTEDPVESYMGKLAEDFGDEMNQFVHWLEADFKKIMEERAIGVQSDYSITVPKISVRSVWTSALNAANRQIEARVDELDASKNFGYYLASVLTLGFYALHHSDKKGQIRASLPQEAWGNIRPKLIAHFTDSMTRLQKEINALINDFCGRYKRQFDRELQGRQRDMESLEGDKRTNEELRDEISALETEKKTFEDNIKKCTQIAGEL